MTARPEQKKATAVGMHSRESVLAFVRALVCEVVDESPVIGKKGKLALAADILHLKPARVLRYWQNRVQVIEAYEYRNVIERAQENRRRLLKQQEAELERRRQELRETDSLLASLAPPPIGMGSLLDNGEAPDTRRAGPIDDCDLRRGILG